MTNVTSNANPSPSSPRRTPKFPRVAGSHDLEVKTYAARNKAGLGVEALAVAAKAGARPVRLEAFNVGGGEAKIILGLGGDSEPRSIRATDTTLQRIFEHRRAKTTDADPDAAAPAATHRLTVRTFGIATTFSLLELVAAYISLERLEFADLSDGDAESPVIEINAWLIATSRTAHANFSAALDAFLRRTKATGGLTLVFDAWGDPGTLGFGGTDGPDADPDGGPSGGRNSGGPGGNAAQATPVHTHARPNRTQLAHPDARGDHEPWQNCDIN